jgi:hypothetical protein
MNIKCLFLGHDYKADEPRENENGTYTLSKICLRCKKIETKIASKVIPAIKRANGTEIKFLSLEN